MTSVLSSIEIVEASPVVPRITTPSVPDQCERYSKEGKEKEKEEGYEEEENKRWAEKEVKEGR
jgi:hypothetical protein